MSNVALGVCGIVGMFIMAWFWGRTGKSKGATYGFLIGALLVVLSALATALKGG